MDKQTSPPPDHNPKSPQLKLPAGACDCHFHLFGPQSRFPLKPHRSLVFEDCTLNDLIAMHDTLGFSRGLIVQSYQHGYSYEYLLHALMRVPNRFRAICSPAPDITDGELEILDRAGVVGIRIRPSVNFDQRTIERVHELGWQVHFAVKGEAEITAWRDKILAVPNHFVLDHMANPPPSKGIGSVEFRFVRDCMDTGRCWAKLSPRFSEQELLPFSDVLPFIRVLVEHYPDRLLWGSDWPHPHYDRPMPNDADLLDLTLNWVPDDGVRNRIFVDNPAELCGFLRS